VVQLWSLGRDINDYILRKHMMSPPPIIQTMPSPVKRPALLFVIGLSLGATLLFILNLFVAFEIVALQNPHAGSIRYLFGIIEGYFLIPLVVIMSICVFWKSNRRPYRLFLCFFWVLLGLLILKVLTLFSLLGHAQTSAVQVDTKPTSEGIHLQSEPRLLTGSVLKDEDLQFSMTIPDGFREYPQGIQFEETKYCYLKGVIGDDEKLTIINIKKLDGLLSPDLALNRKRLREQLPAQSELITKQWRGLTIDAYTMSVDKNGSSILIYTMRVPLKPAAIELAVAGSASKRDELNRLADELLASLEGESNW
jgi:hypothetical protein